MPRPVPGLVALVAALVLAGCGGGGSSSSAAPPPPKRSAFLGVNDGGPLVAAPKLLPSETQLMARTNVGALRIPFAWSALAPARGRFDFTSTDPIVTAAARSGLDLLPVVVGTPDWAALYPGRRGSPPRDPADFAALLTALVERYGPNGSFWFSQPSVPKRPVTAWQIWNEPNHTYYWSDQPFEAGYVKLLRAARSAIKAADPDARVVLAGFPDRSWEILARLEKAGAHGLFDVAAVHPYTFEPRNVLKIVELDRAALRRGGDGKTPLWLTEVTWSSGKGKVTKPLGFETTRADQAARLKEALPLLARNRARLGIERMYWYAWITFDADPSRPFDFSGLRTARLDGVRPKPAFAAFKQVAQALK